jgi:hypothetical protein
VKSLIRALVMNRSKSFINQNRFKSARAIKRLSKVVYDKHKKGIGK